MIDQSSIATRIREERRRKDVSQESLAAEIGVSASYMNKLEHNKKGISLNMLAEIAIALDVSADYLIFGNRFEQEAYHSVFYGCNEKERQIIREVLSAIKCILIKNR